MDIVKAFSDNEATAEINIQGTYDEPLFQANQIGNLLGIQNIRATIKDFDENERHVNTIYTSTGPKECIFLTESGLYKLLIISRKPIAKQFQKWVFNVIKEIRTTGKYELQGQLKDVIKQSKLDVELTRHKTLLETCKNSNGVYIGKIQQLDNEMMLIKIGSSQNLVKRVEDLKKHFGSLTLMDFFEANRFLSYERSIQFDPVVAKYAYTDEINGHKSVETFCIPNSFYPELISIAKRKQKDYQGLSEEHIFQLELKKKEIELLEKQKELDLIALQKLQIENNLPQTIIQEVAIPTPDPRNRKESKGFKIQKYTPDGKLVKTFNGLCIVAREEPRASESGVKQAIINKRLYKEHRWLFLDRSKPDDTIQDIGETTKTTKQNLDFVAMLDIKKETILHVFPDQRTAADNRQLKSVAGIQNSIRHNRVCRGHYFVYFSKCSKELQDSYLAHNSLPKIPKKYNSVEVKKLHPVTKELVKIYTSYSEITKFHRICANKLKDVIAKEEIYGGYKWSY